MPNSYSSFIGLIGDIHCQDRYLEEAIRHFRSNGIKAIYCTGDIVDGCGNVHRCIEHVKAAGVKLVLGNHDDWLLRDFARDLPDATPRNELSEDEIFFLEQLPKTIAIKTPNGLALLCHGFGQNNMSKINPDDYGYALDANNDLQEIIRDGKYEIVINGHSHRKMVRNIQGLTVINAGSLIAEQEPGFMTIDFSKKTVTLLVLGRDGGISKESVQRF